MDYNLPGSPVHGMFPGKNTGEGCHFLLQGIFLTQGSNLCLLHWQVGSLSLSLQGSPWRVSAVQFSSVAQSCLTLCDPMNRSTPGLSVHHKLLESTQTHVHRVSDAIQPSHPLRPLLLLPPIPPSIRVFSNASTLCIRWPKYWSFSFSISPSSEHPGLISLRMDWLDLLVQRVRRLKSRKVLRAPPPVPTLQMDGNTSVCSSKQGGKSRGKATDPEGRSKQYEKQNQP